MGAENKERKGKDPNFEKQKQSRKLPFPSREERERERETFLLFPDREKEEDK